jgi:hypothetical protein
MLRIGNDSAGFTQLLAAIAELAPGPRVAVSLEGSRSYGIGLARALTAAGLLVIECEQPARRQRRGKGKSDPIDAHLAVLAALRLDAGHLPRCAPMVTGRRCASCSAPGRSSPRRAPGRPTGCAPCCWPATTPTAGCPRRADRDGPGVLAGAGLPAMPAATMPCGRRRSSGSRSRCSRPGAAQGQPRPAAGHRGRHRPGLTDRYGVGPVTAAQAVVSFSHPGRCRNEAAFAALAGTSPLPASSGRTVRHRLNRGGDRRLNCAIHTIALTRSAAAPHPRLHRPTHRRGKDPTRDPPLPQALHRPRALPTTHPLDATGEPTLTNIEASEVGVRVPSGAQKIKALTAENVGPGLDSFPENAAIFHILGAGCSDGTSSVFHRPY